jgi:hypothetical protein
LSSFPKTGREKNTQEEEKKAFFFSMNPEISKKELRMYRNRKSAAESRNKKKAYIQHLENLIKAQSEYITELESTVDYYDGSFERMKTHLEDGGI